MATEVCLGIGVEMHVLDQTLAKLVVWLFVGVRFPCNVGRVAGK